MGITRRDTLISGLAAAASGLLLPACQAAPSAPAGADGRTQVYVLGTLHGYHRRSERYSLDVLRRALIRAKPDRLLAEIPPDRIAEAYRSFAEEGRVTEPRTAVFPEYVDVAFPLTRTMDFSIIGTAGWTARLARERTAALERIASDPARRKQWAQHLSARRKFASVLNGRGDDPLFIHTPAYDAIVEEAQTPYQRFFDDDLGAGGWSQINAAHNALINGALDDMSGTGGVAVITFGTLHKYMILRSLAARQDIVLRDPRALFA